MWCFSLNRKDEPGKQTGSGVYTFVLKAGLFTEKKQIIVIK
jgi:hypothetical protein